MPYAFLLKYRAEIALGAAILLAITGLWMWHVSEVSKARDEGKQAGISEAVRAQNAETVEQVRDEEREAATRRSDSRIVSKAQDVVAGVDFGPAPLVPASYFRMLNQIGTEPSSPGNASGEVPRASRLAGEGH